MAMDNTLLLGNCPIETPISSGFPIARFDYRRVTEVGDVITMKGFELEMSAMSFLNPSGDPLKGFK